MCEIRCLSSTEISAFMTLRPFELKINLLAALGGYKSLLVAARHRIVVENILSDLSIMKYAPLDCIPTSTLDAQ